jgi:rhodanese-related sulfurtransferase
MASPIGQSRGQECRRTLLEALPVGVGGLVLALLANQLSPRGLSLTRDYFPGAGRRSVHAVPAREGASGTGTTNASASSSSEDAALRLKEKGLQLIEKPVVVQLFRDPRFEAELVVFVDARDDQHYQEGHIPGAYQFDHYRPENYLPAVLPACQNAERIVVYCNGGNCEDSEFAALTLRANGVPSEKLLVYAGGMTEWATNGLPVETGARKSGILREAKP